MLIRRPAAPGWTPVEQVLPDLPGPAPTLDGAADYLERHLGDLVLALSDR